MGDISFVNSPDQKTTGTNKKNNAPEVKWTKPSDEGGFSATKKQNQNSVVKTKIKNEKTKVAVIDKKIKLAPKELEKKSNFIQFFVNLFKREDSSNKENLNNNSFKKEKNLLAKQGVNLSNEKNSRTSSNIQEINNDKTEEPSKVKKIVDNRINYSEAKKLSISEAIKMKLKLDSFGGSSTNTIKTNLIKDEITTYVDWKKNGTDLILNILVSIIIVVIAYGGLMYREHRAIMQEQGIDAKIKSLNKQLDEALVNIGDIDVFQKKMSLVTNIINEHVYWTNFFKFLEKTILEEVTYAGTFSGGPDGSYGFSATADSFQTVENQVRVLRNNKLVKSVSVKSVSFKASNEDDGINIPTVNFSISFEVDEKLFNITSREFDNYFLSQEEDF